MSTPAIISRHGDNERFERAKWMVTIRLDLLELSIHELEFEPTFKVSLHRHDNATPAWLSLPHRERERVVAEEVQPILARRRKTVQTRYHDTEAYSAQVSDVLMLEFDHPGAHANLSDDQRSSALFAKPYFGLEELLVGDTRRGYASANAQRSPATRFGAPGLPLMVACGSSGVSACGC